MIKTPSVIIMIIALVRLSALAQTTDSTLKKSPVKTLTDKQYNALITGEDLYNMPLVAELNHYPMPGKAIKYRKEIGLSPVQISKINVIDKELHRKRIEMGVFVIRNERALDSLFKRRMLNEGIIIFYTNRYGLYQGELRDCILQACYNTWKLMSPQQIKQLETLENSN